MEMQDILLDYIFRQINSTCHTKADLKRLKMVIQFKKQAISRVPLFSYITLASGLTVGLLFSLSKISTLGLVGPLNNRMPITQLFFISVLTVIVLKIASFISYTPIKRAVCQRMDRFLTKPEQDYQEDIESFLNSLKPILAENKSIELPPFLSKDFSANNIVSIVKLFTKRLMPENLSLVLLDCQEDKFLVKASMGLKQDLIEKTALTRDCRLIYWLGKIRSNISQENLSKSIIGSKYRRNDPAEINSIREEMDLVKAEVCSQIYCSTTLVGFLSLGRKLIGTYTQDDLAALSYLSNHLSRALIDSMLKAGGELGERLQAFKEYENMFREYKTALEKEMVLEEAKIISTGEDERLVEKIKQNPRLLTWYLFVGEIHSAGLTVKTKGLMQENYALELPLGYRLDAEHNKRVGLYVRILAQEAGLHQGLEKQPYSQEETLKWLRHQSEWFDGSGYPDSLKGKEIPLASQLLCLAEAFDIFYSSWQDTNKTMGAIESFSGTKFDPALVEILKKACQEAKIP